MPATRPPNDARPAVSLSGLTAFETVARHLNFARAAEELAVSPTAMSKTVKTLEAQLGVRLFNRTTRSVSLTEHGAQLLGSLSPALELIKTSVQEVGETAARPRGALRINTSYVAYASLIEPHQAAFLRRYPDVALELVIEDRFVDIVAGGFDAGLRLGKALQRDMVAVPVGAPQKMVVVAAPAYLNAHGTPAAPQDLLAHDCIRLRFLSHGRFLEWRLGTRERAAVVDVRGRLIFSEMRSVLDAATRGLGLAYVFEQYAREPLRRGELVKVLERHGNTIEPFYVYYPHRAHMPGKLRAFVEFLRAVNKAA